MTMFWPHGMSHGHTHTHAHSGLDEPRGLALSDKSIFVAHNGGVSEYDHHACLHAACCMLHAACCVLYGCDGRYDLVSFENKRTVDVWAKASPSREGRSNGICLNADYTKLYPTTLETCIVIDVGWAARGEWLLSHGWLT